MKTGRIDCKDDCPQGPPNDEQVENKDEFWERINIVTAYNKADKTNAIEIICTHGEFKRNNNAILSTKQLNSTHTYQPRIERIELLFEMMEKKRNEGNTRRIGRKLSAYKK